jgi:hypothetical protein
LGKNSVHKSCIFLQKYTIFAHSIHDLRALLEAEYTICEHCFEGRKKMAEHECQHCAGVCGNCADQAALGCNPLGRCLAIVMAGLAQSVEIVLNTGNQALLDELERCCLDVFKQAHQAMTAQRGKFQ